MKTVCSVYQKMKVSEEVWTQKKLTQVEQNVASHGYCPYCFDVVIREIEASQELERQYAIE